MATSRTKQSFIITAVALIVVIVAQVLTLIWEGRLNPGLIMMMTLLIILMYGMRRPRTKKLPRAEL